MCRKAKDCDNIARAKPKQKNILISNTLSTLSHISTLCTPTNLTIPEKNRIYTIIEHNRLSPNINN